MDMVNIDVRAPIFLRELLFVLAATCNDEKHATVKELGLDRQSFDFIKGANTATLLVLSQKLHRANAIKVKFNDVLLHKISCAIQSGATDLTCSSFATPISTANEIFFHPSVVREVVLMLSDSVSGVGDLDFVAPLEIEVRSFLNRATMQDLETFACNIIRWRGIEFNFDSVRINSITHEVMRHTRRESIKDLIILKGAPAKMVSMLFREENDEKQKIRRMRLGVVAKKGRPYAMPQRDLDEFVQVWYQHRTLSKVDRFLQCHAQTGFDFARLYALFSQAARTEEYSDLFTDYSAFFGSSAAANQ